MKSFSVAPTPQLHFGVGKISVLASILKPYGLKVLLVTGARSFLGSAEGISVMEQLEKNEFAVSHISINKEPTPFVIDEAVKKFSLDLPHVVVAIGGGSVLDAGKAISAMLPINEPVKSYLEGVGTHPSHPGVKIPFIAVPTTAGTGSEATKNAVLSEIGEHGYKKSLRHQNFVPNVAIVDPALTVLCPPSVTASSGMDAFTQLLESYLSTAANPVTDALALEGLHGIARSLTKVYHDGKNLQARTDMALAAYLSGITLANAGLGLVHGFASSIGGMFEISHGVICSALMAPANKITVRKLREEDNKEALSKYAIVGKMFLSDNNKSQSFYIDGLLNLIESCADQLNIPSLGIEPAYFSKLTQATDNKSNPVALNHNEMMEVLSLTR